jgi:hypothetical protein
MSEPTPLREPPRDQRSEPPMEPVSLADLGKKIKSEHEALANSLRGIVPRALSIGEDLNKAKAKIAHGGFLKWVKLHCAMTNKTAERYMNLATNKDKLMAKLRELAREGEDEFETISNLSLAQAERLITGKSGGGGKGDNVSGAYDRAQDKLLEKLDALSAEVAEAAAAETIERLKVIVEAKKKTLKEAA